MFPYLENNKSVQDNLYKLIDNFNKDFNNYVTVFSSFSTKFNTYSKNFDNFAYNVNTQLTKLYNTLWSINDKLSDLNLFYYPTDDINTDYSLPTREAWLSFWSTFSTKKFDEVLIDVHNKIEDEVNPLSENNSVAYEGAITNIKENTFIGSANEIATTFPEELKAALNKDSSPVLQFTTSGVSNSYFSLPAKKYSIDFSWYAPFKGTVDNVISAFMYLGFLIAFWKRLPEIINGAGVATVSYADFQDVKFEDHLAESYYNHLVDNGGVDDYGQIDGYIDRHGVYHDY